MKILTSAEIRAIRERAGKATQGPWGDISPDTKKRLFELDKKLPVEWRVGIANEYAVGFLGAENYRALKPLEGIALCWGYLRGMVDLSDVPALCDAVEEARKERSDARSVIRELIECFRDQRIDLGLGLKIRHALGEE